jgi:outer membrane lipopolysaccharide assembly protein LptE/RlpB
MSHVTLVSAPQESTAILDITHESATQHFLSVNGTQQTRQYNLIVSATFQIMDKNGRILFGPETLEESKPITIQSNQILGSSNEASLYYNHMRRGLAYAIMNRISSLDVAKQIKEKQHEAHLLPAKTSSR